ncbi:MAG: ribosome recycling factor [Candidatus Marinimicrobia bacterium]|nr:ribosome recycling factor [Candidatus Neomarinimicrobiota bacterium]
MIDTIINDAEHRMDQAVVHTRAELAKIRTGRANPEIFNAIQVDYYGSKMPLNQVSNMSVPEPRLITIQPYEKTLIPVIEKAILEHNLGLNPTNNGTAIMVPIPALSEERRKELIRVIHRLTEEGRIAIRNVRRDANQHLKTAQDEEHISEDEIKRAEKETQELTDKHIEILNTDQEEKEKEILEV